MRQFLYSMCITNNHASFRLWWKENLVKYQEVSKYYVHDCRLWHMRHAITHTCLSTHLKHAKKSMQKKACLVLFKKLQGVWQIARLKQQRFLSFTFCITTKILRENHVYLFFISLVKWWKLYYIFILHKEWQISKELKRNMNDGTIVFLTSLLIVLTWKIFNLLSFWYKIIWCFQ